MDIVKRNNLVLGNGHQLCEGSITRKRIVEKRKEESIIDFLIVCDKLEPFLKEMTLYECRKYSLYRSVKTK